jgi:hypothetical protein
LKLNTEVSFSIYNLLGRQVKGGKSHSFNGYVGIDDTSLTSGIYTVLIEYAGRRSSAKLVVE